MRVPKRRWPKLTDVQIAAAVALGALPVLARAAEPDALEEGFLEYLAEFDDEQADWNWFDRDDKATAVKKSEKKESERGTNPAQKEKP